MFAHDTKRSTLALARTALVLAALGASPPAAADDRDLLRESTGRPYVFIIFDTSGSMNWSPQCTQAQLTAGECDYLCEDGDCFVPMNADDPRSKFFQAKEALAEVMGRIDDVDFGFATYNQDSLFVRSKHWLYKAASPGVNIPNWGPFPAAGSEEVFGFQWACDTGSGDNKIGCAGGTPADLIDAWELERVKRLPKGGDQFTQSRTFYIRHETIRYRVIYTPQSGNPGDATVVFNVNLATCTNASCSTVAAFGNTNVAYRLVDQFISWDNRVIRDEEMRGYFATETAAVDGQASTNNASTCGGWDPNDDSFTTNPRDAFNGYSIRQLTDTTDPRGPLFHSGDVIPLDWEDDNRDEILSRLSPTPGNFNSASYFRNRPSGTDAFVRLNNENLRPMIANGQTPLGNAIKSFRTWYAGCGQGTCPGGGGWKDIAAASDPDWACRRKFLLVITDGDDTCGGADACAGTASLFAQESLKTFVVAFGVQNTAGNRLNCMASNGGTGDPVYPANKEQLVDALTEIFGQIVEEATSFASAAVPSVQAEVADKLYLTSFTPLNEEPIWDGHVNAFLKPLPLTADGRPDLGRRCGGSVTSSCLIWDAGEVLLTQAPDAAEAAGANLRLGLANDQRRVFYPKGNGTSNDVPRELRLFEPPLGTSLLDPEWTDLFFGLKITFNPLDTAPAKTRARRIITQTLVEKTAEVELLGGGTRNLTYLLGDVFHADPVLVDNPDNFQLYAANVHGLTGTTSCINNPGYRCYAERSRRRRKMLLVASNDGQLHVFDAGVYNPGTKKFSNGTGIEIFSYMPRLTMPIVRDLAERSDQIFSVDGTPRVDDIFIDPEHDGTPLDLDRRWRTVVIGGFREGGSIDGGGRVTDAVSGYYALDVTQPDVVTAGNDPTNQNTVPGCLREDNQPASGCGQRFPAVLWEFTDSLAGARLDEDSNNAADLGATWSVPTIGRIMVTDASGNRVDKSVAIFGGGYDPTNKLSPRSGTWIYIVDIETGRAIYKAPLVGAAAADPAVVDVNQDGLLDTIYQGTTAGYMYKLDISKAADLLPRTIDRTRFLPALLADQTTPRVVDPAWSPFIIFNTGGRPIFYAPTAFYVSPLNRFALAFGSGNREDLWTFNGLEGRFYLMIDEKFTATSSGLPRTEAQYQVIAVADPNSIGEDFVINPDTGKERGWVMHLDPDERIITQAFGLSGIVIFSSYKPQIVVTEDDESGGRDDDTLCARGGTSRVFVVFANNANSIIQSEDGATQPGSGSGEPGEGNTRYLLVPEFVTNPFVEQGATKNDGAPNNHSERLDAVQKGIMESLKDLYSEGTKFANYWISVSGIRSDTGYIRYATIPIGIIQKNWKEH
jgi:Tfp pilus tip-associated adhesin PilY1